MKTYYVYILSNKRNGTLYIGVTNNLLRRVYQHKKKIFKEFTSAYDIDKLVYFEDTNDINIAIEREKKMKKCDRKWKLDLIESQNPRWRIYIMKWAAWIIMKMSMWEYKRRWIPAFAMLKLDTAGMTSRI